MDAISVFLGLAAVAGGAVAVWLGMARAKLTARLSAAETARDAAAAELVSANGKLEEERRLVKELTAQAAEDRGRLAALHTAREEELARVGEMRREFEHAFGALAAKALESSSDQFLKLARQTFAVERERGQADLTQRKAEVDGLIKPIGEAIREAKEKLAQIEKERTSAYASLTEQIKGVNAAHEMLRGETGKLVKALSKPEVRGRYGEIQLRRVAELAGMTPYCDFQEQSTSRDDQGRMLRPDLIVRLPNERLIVVDAKTNTQAYIEACDAATEGERGACLDRFARHMAEQVTQLSKKGYWAELKGSPDFVVMFVPGDQFLDAALGRRPDLLDLAVQQGVILTTPATLIGLLRAVAIGWREKRVAEEAEALMTLGKQLHERAAVMYEYIDKMGGALANAVNRYNDMKGSWDTRLTPTLRRFEEAGAKSGRELSELPEVTVRPRVSGGILDGVEGMKGENAAGGGGHVLDGWRG